MLNIINRLDISCIIVIVIITVIVTVIVIIIIIKSSCVEVFEPAGGCLFTVS